MRGVVNFRLLIGVGFELVGVENIYVWILIDNKYFLCNFAD